MGSKVARVCLLLLKIGTIVGTFVLLAVYEKDAVLIDYLPVLGVCFGFLGGYMLRIMDEVACETK